MTNNFGPTLQSSASIPHPVCPVCGDASSAVLLCEVDAYTVYACHRCSMEYVSPVPNVLTLKAYYDRKDWFENGERGGYKDYDAQTEWSLDLFRSLLEGYSGRSGLSILDVGCGYGTHLAIASELGWKCFGVELSDHARKIAKSRLGHSAYLVESVSDLIPHEFDLIVMFDVIEHLDNPYQLFYELFSIGAITPKTKIIITTPNAGSIDARRDPSGWAYRHPPSHLLFYTQDSLIYLLKRLQFQKVNIEGLHPISGIHDYLKIESYSGLIAYASCSNFTEFMRERYVPGTWSKLARYEHIPRYQFALKFAVDKHVLDFGCGTGYGSAMLADVAKTVTGLDIDSQAQAWAQECHRNPKLNFYQCADLGASLESQSFDLITCFEMIEHVNHETQKSSIVNFSRLLKDDGLLFISTPNPRVTELYGANPYHLREMNEIEFLELLSGQFPHVTLLKQKVRISLSFDVSKKAEEVRWSDQSAGECSQSLEPLAFIAICSKKEFICPTHTIFFENDDYILEYMKVQNKLHLARNAAYSFEESLAVKSKLVDDFQAQAEIFKNQALSFQRDMESAQSHIRHLYAELADRDRQILKLRS